jgi:phosphatidylserine decarboxylase
MTVRAAIMKISRRDALNFLLTNRIPRRTLTRFFGWFSRIENPVVCALSLRVWRLFTDLDLSDARETRFRCLHACFTRTLKDGARPVESDPAVLVSPCDGIVGAFGLARDGAVAQVKGSRYRLDALLGDREDGDRDDGDRDDGRYGDRDDRDDRAGAAPFRNGCYVTLRLTSAMYHHFHAPHDCRVESVTHIPGDVWNVNPPALRRVANLFCRNERAVIRTRLTAAGHPVLLVPVAAILVAGIRLRFLDLTRDPGGARRTWRTTAALEKGAPMGWFEHGSTIILLAPEGFRPHESVTEGMTIRMGRPLLRLPDRHAVS